MLGSLVMIFCAVVTMCSIAILAQGRPLEPAAKRWRLRALAAASSLLLALPAWAQSVSYSGVSPSTFSGPGQTLTVSFQVSNGATYSDFYKLEFQFGFTFTNINCPFNFDSPLGTNTTVTCTADYTTTETSNITFAGGSFNLIRKNNDIPIGSAIGGSVTATYVAPGVSSNANLASLALSAGTLSPAFTSGTLS